MAFTFHGIGTMVYGERDYWPDGSFVTTEWFVIAFVPLLPVISKRIGYTRSSDYATYDASGYWVYHNLPLSRRQVLFTYGWFASMITPIVLWANFQNSLAKIFGDEDKAAGLFLLIFAIVLALPYFLRRRAKMLKAKEWERQRLGLHSGPSDR
jgi:hypothetical protein